MSSCVSNARLAALVPTVGEAVRAAGRAILQFYGSGPAGMRLSAKPDASPLTAADLAADSVLQAALADLVPDCPVISEERASEWPPERRLGLRQCWLVDPLDGTREFVAGNGEFCVCVALVQDGVPVFGAIYLPTTGQTYTAYRGAGHVIRFEADGAEVALPTRAAFDAEQPGLRIGVSRHHAGHETEAYLRRYPGVEKVPMGSAMKFCAIAEGTLDLYPRFGTTMLWDTAAGQCLLACTGRSVVDAQTGLPLRYDLTTLSNPGFVAGL